LTPFCQLRKNDGEVWKLPLSDTSKLPATSRCVKPPRAALDDIDFRFVQIAYSLAPIRNSNSFGSREENFFRRAEFFLCIFLPTCVILLSLQCIPPRQLFSAR